MSEPAIVSVIEFTGVPKTISPELVVWFPDTEPKLHVIDPVPVTTGLIRENRRASMRGEPSTVERVMVSEPDEVPLASSVALNGGLVGTLAATWIPGP